MHWVLGGLGAGGWGELFNCLHCAWHCIKESQHFHLCVCFLPFPRNACLGGGFLSQGPHPAACSAWHNGSPLLVMTSKRCHNNNNSLWLLAHHLLITAAVRQSIKWEQLPARKNKYNNTLWLVEHEFTLRRVPGKEGRAKLWHFAQIC